MKIKILPMKNLFIHPRQIQAYIRINAKKCVSYIMMYLGADNHLATLKT
jgi:hypothetical protein